MTNMLHEGRRAGASFYIAGDLNIEFGLLCTGDDDVGDPSEVHGAQCWQGCDADPGGFKKMMWYDIMKKV